ncbi:DUF4249 domain-containing protein [Nonlabens agnitus]|uniref:DUF4249 domain-containing protein n=1 Tax=Nonlabens agnitus TaxID=870484 RepID=A0A2S9WQY0_9FLAO|nr:DUF4249 domain-containing protein [Nonlabens agnitus]PRP65897.1 hypothetical protein BST86_01725 [Nonlabens agnitus]
MKKWFYIILLAVSFIQCEDVIDVDLNTAASRLVIDGRLELLSDGSSRNTIRLTRSSGFFEEVNPVVSDASVQVVVNNGISFPFRFDETRNLYINNNLSLEEGSTYTLEIVDGNDFYRANQQLISTVPLGNIEQTEVSGFGDFTQITAFFQDPEALGDYYLFTYEDPDNFQLDVSDDEFINGNLSPTSFFVEDLEPGTNIQLSITGIDAQAFQFFETLIQQTDDSGGGPFDTQPAVVKGNVFNERNPDRFPFGYFRVAQVYELNYVSE